MNTKRAAEVLVSKDFTTLIQEESLKDGESFTITVTIPESQKLTASICLTVPVSIFVNSNIVNNTTAALVNDLDIRITNYYPWKLSAANTTKTATKGDNLVDTFEKVDVENAIGEYTIKITHKGALTNASQNFSLVVSGVSVTDCKINAPQNLEVIGKEDSVSLQWEELSDTMFEIQYKEGNSQDWITKYTDDNNLNIVDLQIDTTYEVRMRAFFAE